MTQYARPTATVTNAGSWTANGGPTTLWECLDEVTPSDTDYMRGTGAAKACALALGAVTDPATGAGHTWRIRARATGSSGAEKLTLELYQDTVLVATLLSAATITRTTFNNYTGTLTAAQADAITNYALLRFRFVTGNNGTSETIDVSHAVLEVPDAVVNYSLTADPLQAGAALLPEPAIAQAHRLAAVALAVGAVLFAAPAMTQAHVLAAEPTVAGAVTMGAPALVEHGQGYALTAQPLTWGAATFGAPALVQAQCLEAQPLAALPVALGQPGMTQSEPTLWALEAVPLSTWAASLGAPLVRYRLLGDVHVTTYFEYGEVEDLGGGQFRLTQGIVPRNYLANGGYQPINTTWVSGDASFPNIVTSAGMRVLTAGDHTLRILPVPGHDDVWGEVSSPYIRLAGGGWTQPSLGTFTRQGNVLSASTANVDTRIAHAGHFIDPQWTLRNLWRPIGGEFAFRVGMQGLVRDGGRFYYQGVEVMHVRTPYAYNADEPQQTWEIPWEFVQLGGDWYIHFTLPAASNGVARLVVDPTVTLPAVSGDSEDTLIFVNTPTFNYGIAVTVNAGLLVAAKERGLLRIVTSSIPASATVSAATLTLVCTSETAADNRNVAVHRALTQWFEGVKNGAAPDAGQDGSTWNLRNANGAVAWAGGAGGGSGTDYAAVATATTLITGVGTFTWNVLADVQAWVATPAANLGLWLIGDEVNNNSFKAFGSGDNATPANRPTLAVTYALRSSGGWFMSGPVGNQLYSYIL